MRTLSCVLCVALLSSLAWAQGAGTSTKPTIAQQMRTNGTASPGYMQSELLKDLQKNLEKQFGLDRSNEMMGTLQGQELKPTQVQDLLNGKTTKSGLQDLLGAQRDELAGVEKALGQTVDGKNRKMLFGVIIIVMIVDFDLAPDSEFCKQVCGARDEMSAEEFDKLRKGSTSKGTMESCFGLKSREDQDLMQDVMKRVREMPSMDHPMAASLGMGDPKEFDPSQFPPLGEGMPGFGENADGMAGGLPFDMKMPPCPFAGENMEDLFPPPEEAPAETGSNG